ncbi:MAG: AMP-binding protein [Woeseia sp.]
MNIATHMIRAGRAFGDHPSIARGATTLSSYGDLAHRVSCVAGALRRECKLDPGDRVALILGNCPEYLELLYAIWHAGLVAVPINAKLHSKEFAYVLDNSQSRLCFVSPEIVDSAGQTDTVIVTGSDEYRKLLAGDPLPLVFRNPDDAAWLFYTSGTTGTPKGAVLTHRNLEAMCECYFVDVDPIAPWNAILHAAPMSHGSGLYALAYVMQAGCHVIPESGRFDVAEVYALIREWPGVAFWAAPTMVKRLLDHPEDEDTSNLKAIIYGGGPMYVEDCLAAPDRFGPKLTQLYGQGESPMTITALNADMHAARRRLSSVGVAQSAVEVRIGGSDDEALPPGEPGEILVRGDTVMREYWRNAQATAETLRNGWLHTGDIGVMDEDGFLTLKDRAKDLIISGGVNIYPREVEEVLINHPGVAEVSVIGRPDREWGEIVVAYLVATDNAGVDAKALDDFCIENLARFKRPKQYRFIDEMPKNNYGKVLKTALRDLDAAD